MVNKLVFILKLVLHPVSLLNESTRYHRTYYHILSVPKSAILVGFVGCDTFQDVSRIRHATPLLISLEIALAALL